MADSVPPMAGTTGITPGDGMGVSDGKGVAKTITQDRAMKCYILTDFEMEGLSSMNGACTFCVGVATALLGVAAGIKTSAAFSDPKTISPAAELLAGPGFWASAVLGLAFAVAAGVSYYRALGAVGRIKAESKKNA